MPHDNQYWDWELSSKIIFAPATAVGVRWTFLGHREWGFSLDQKWIVFRDGVIGWDMLRRRQDLSVLTVENNKRGFFDIVPKLRWFGREARTFDMTWDFLKAVFDISEEEMPHLPELLKQRYGGIAWHPYLPSMNPQKRPASDLPMEVSNLDGDLMLNTRWESHHWRCECGRRLVCFQKHPHSVYYCELSLFF